ELAHAVLHRLDWINDARAGLETLPQLVDIIDLQIDRAGQAWAVPGHMGIRMRQHDVGGVQSNARKAFQLECAGEAKLLHIKLHRARNVLSRERNRDTLNSHVLTPNHFGRSSIEQVYASRAAEAARTAAAHDRRVSVGDNRPKRLPSVACETH